MLSPANESNGCTAHPTSVPHWWAVLSNGLWLVSQFNGCTAHPTSSDSRLPTPDSRLPTPARKSNQSLPTLSGR
ncbi:MAG: hypothetical protein F6K26_47330 [Moorea sp. SIO2I5]|nr:hypothetical protein [Moorena sp. SIO2I5]